MGGMMKSKILFLVGLLLATSVSAEVATNLTDAYLLNTMLPLAQQFCAKAGMTNFTQISTNQIKRYRREDFYERPGCIADLALTNKFTFSCRTEKNTSEIRSFQQNQQKTYYSLTTDTPVEKIRAVQALLKQNKLNEIKALALARKYFSALGHDEKNFHPPEILQGYWFSGNMKYRSGRLPAYTVTWYRKDVTDAALKPETGEVYRQPSINIEVSGIDSSLISYHRNYMPIGSDF
jgi:hypothetical protein